MDYLFGVGEVAVDVQLEFGLRQLLLDGNTADWADLELLLLLCDLDDSRGGSNTAWLLLLELVLELMLFLLLLVLDGLLHQLALNLLLQLLLLLLLVLVRGDQSQGVQLVLQLVQELLNALQCWLLLGDLLELDWDH